MTTTHQSGPSHDTTPAANGSQEGTQRLVNTPGTTPTTDTPEPVTTEKNRPHGGLEGDTADDAAGGAELLDEVLTVLRRYVIFPSESAAHAVVLWIAATHVQPAWAHASRLVIRAPEKRCGKSRLLDMVEATCWNALISVNSSPSAIYRSITDDPPTLLLDEADAIFGPNAGANEDLRGLLNAGHQRNRPVTRYNAAKDQVERIPSFAMAALAGIGNMPDTIEDRAVIVRMRRRTAGEKVAPYRYRRDRPQLQRLATDLHTWARQALPVLEQAAPDMPVEDRAADTWESLVAIADHAGGAWPDRARAACVTLLAEADNTDQGSDGVRLLIDCHTALNGEHAIPTTLLLERLNGDPEAPWSDYGPAGLTARRLCLLLDSFDIAPDKIRIAGIGQTRGFTRAAFLDAWARYAPSVLTDPGNDPTPEQGRGPASPASTVSPQVSPEAIPHPEAVRPASPISPEAGQPASPQQPASGLTRQKAVEAVEAVPRHLRAVGGDA